MGVFGGVSVEGKFRKVSAENVAYIATGYFGQVISYIHSLSVAEGSKPKGGHGLRKQRRHLCWLHLSFFSLCVVWSSVEERKGSPALNCLSSALQFRYTSFCICVFAGKVGCSIAKGSWHGRG